MTKPKKPSKEVLEDLYVVQGLKDEQIAEMFERSSGAVFYWRKCYGISGRKRGVLVGTSRPEETRQRMSKARLTTGVVKPKRDELFQMYSVQKLSDYKIAEIVGGCSAKTVQYWRKGYGIESRSRSAAASITKTPEVRKKMSMMYLGRQFSFETRKKMSNAKLEMIYKSDETLREAVESANKMRVNNQKYQLEGLLFDSKSEAAVGVLLQRYIPGYSAVFGKTFQANGDTCCTFDFVLENLVLEWHPIRIEYALQEGDKTAYRQIETEARQMGQLNEFLIFKKELKSELAVEYWMRRQEASDNSGIYQGKEVILATNFNEFYELVLRKYGDKNKLKTKTELRKEFEQLSKNARTVYRGRK